jgi:hypothetical protein
VVAAGLTALRAPGPGEAVAVAAVIGAAFGRGDEAALVAWLP